MKKIYSFIAVIACMAMTYACSERVEPQNPESGVLTISMSSSNLVTRAEMAGVDELNENAINTVHYFFYASGKTNENALKWGSISNINGKSKATVTVNVTEEDINNLFPNSDTKECDVFLIVNLPENVAIEIEDNKTSRAALDTLVLEADFRDNRVQDDFVMTGLGTAVLKNRETILAATGEIGVDRVASKLTMHLDVNHSITDKDKNTWVSDPDNMTVTFCNAQSKALVSEVAGKKAEPALFNYDYDDGTTVLTKTDEDEDEDHNTKWDCTQFYSYPEIWTTGSPEQPYFLITLPWKNQNDGSIDFRNCYYKIYINTASLERNTWYDVNLKLDVLGSFFETEPKVDIPLTYQVCKWSDFSFSTEIQDARFLVVDQNEYVMNNVDILRIPFLSSHDCELVRDTEGNTATVTKRNIKSGGNIPVTEGYSCEIKSAPSADGQIQNYIEYTNVLDNNYISDTFDFVPYTITLTIQHKDDSNFKETITITQYPAIYGLDYENSDYRGDDNINGGKNVWVNGYGRVGSQPNNWKYDFFASCPGMQSGSQYSPNMYVFTVTSLQGTDYIIGDPRTSEYDTDLINSGPKYNSNATSTWYQARDLEGKTRGLKYYYPTDTTKTRRNMIAPKFRIASSYGVLDATADPAKYREAMEKRCASYQEDGYPAGRWRLPTEAEFKFIISQVDKETLPPIYVPDTPYWCAHGVGIPRGGGEVEMKYVTTYSYQDGWWTSGCSTRCVYDEWYWGSEQLLDRSTFTWGDMPR